MNTTAQPTGHQGRKSEIEQALESVLAGSSFRSSAQCQSLLRYIVEHSLNQDNEMLRERVIGISVFGRPPNYDSGNDPIVRARAAEVRKRLAQHYMHSEGVDEEIRIEIPPGSYRAIFSKRASGESSDLDRVARSKSSDELTVSSRSQAGELPTPIENADNRSGANSSAFEVEHPDPQSPRWMNRHLTSGLVAIISIGLAMGAVGFFVGHFSTASPPAPQDVLNALKSQPASDDPVGAFWAPFLKEDHSPIIAYADAMFLIDGAGDLFRFRHGASDNRGVSVDAHLAHEYASNPGLVASAGPLFYDNGYTGTGDLRAVAMLITQLAHQGATPLVESSYDISTDDLKQHNVILLGSSAENLAVAQLVPTGDFMFEGPVSDRDPWSGQILVSHPRAGEQSSYATVRDPGTHVLQEDYAIISFLPGITSDRQIAILGGIDTTGTEGAALLVTSNSGVEELSNALAQINTMPQAGKARAFQALVRVEVKKGYQVLGSHLVTIHALRHPGESKP